MNRQSDDYCAPVLPDIEMYAGETIPLNVKILDNDGAPYTYQDLAIYSASLALLPYKVTYGLGANAMIVPPVLVKTGIMENSQNNELYAVFELVEADTKYLSGKFTYQITVARADDLRICQGHILIKQNIHQTV